MLTFKLVTGLGEVVVLKQRMVDDANGVLELALIVFLQLPCKRLVGLAKADGVVSYRHASMPLK